MYFLSLSLSLSGTPRGGGPIARQFRKNELGQGQTGLFLWPLRAVQRCKGLKSGGSSGLGPRGGKTQPEPTAFLRIQPKLALLAFFVIGVRADMHDDNVIRQCTVDLTVQAKWETANFHQSSPSRPLRPLPRQRFLPPLLVQGQPFS